MNTLQRTLLAFTLVLTGVGSTANAARLEPFILNEGPSSSIFFGVSPIFSQMKLTSTASAAYTGWGFSINSGIQMELIGLTTRLGLNFQRVAGGNDLNTAAIREDSVSSGVEGQVCVVILDRGCVGGGVQRRTISVAQVQGSGQLDSSVSGWSPFAKLSYDLMGPESNFGLTVGAAYYIGTLQTTQVANLQASLAINYNFGLR